MHSFEPIRKPFKSYFPKIKISKVFKKQKFLFTNCVDRLNYKVSKENERWRIDKSRFIILRLDLKTMLYF